MKNAKFSLSTIVVLLWTMFSHVLWAQNLPTDSLNRKKLEEVSISFDKKLSSQPVNSSTFLSRDKIENNIANGSVNNIFDQIPSMVTTSDAGTGLGYTYMRIRGIDHTRINVTINGIALNDAESQGTWFTNLPDFGSHVGSLTVQRGVGNSNSGAAAFGASMDFKTLSASLKPFVELTTSAGSYSTFRNSISASTGLIGNCISTTVSYSNILSNGYMDNATANLNSLFMTTNIKLPTRKNAQSNLKFNLLYGDEKTGLAWNGTPYDSLATNRTYNSCGLYEDENGNIVRYDNETDNYTQTHYQLFYNYSYSRINLSVGGHLTRGIGYYEEYKEDKKFSKYGLNPMEIGGEILKRSDFITRKYLDNYFYGVTFNLSSVHPLSQSKSHTLVWRVIGGANNYDGHHYGNVIWAKHNDGSIIPNYEWYRGKGEKLQTNIAGQLYYMSQNLTLKLDLQHRMINYKILGIDDDLNNIDQSYLWNFFNPKFSAQYNLNKHAFYFLFARANREPTRSDIVDAPKGAKPTPETLYDFELGYALDLAKYKLNANLYGMYYENQLVLTGQINDVGAAIMTNVDRSYRLGIEVSSQYAPVKFFTWNINATLSRNKILDYVHYTESYDEDWNFVEMREDSIGKSNIAFSPNVVLNNEFVFTPIENFHIGLVTKFVSRQMIDNSNDKTYSINPYTVSNLNLSYDFPTIKCRNFNSGMNLRIFCSINNIFNAKYESNAWLYRYYLGEELYFDNGYFPQATTNFIAGIKISF